MEFVVTSVTKGSGRMGHFVKRASGQRHPTPLLLLTTKSGSVPYLSRATVGYVTPQEQMLQMSLATVDQMADVVPNFGGGLSAFVGFKDFPNLATMRDPCEEAPGGFNESGAVPLFTRRGKQMLTPETFMGYMERLKPDIYQGLSDADTGEDSSKKRVQKSVDRTKAFLDYCDERHGTSPILQDALFMAPIVGGYCTYGRTESIKHAKALKNVSGFMLEGFHKYGLTATAVDGERLMEIMEHCRNELNTEKFVVAPGAYTPPTLVRLVRLGLDVFDSSYVYCATRRFIALGFHYDLERPQETTAEEALLDLNAEKFKDDLRPLVENCQCRACSNFTRAYVYHLCHTKELLGNILLMIHNLHHYLRFFDSIRASIQNEKMSDLLALIKYQGGAKEVDYRIYESKTSDSKESFEPVAVKRS